MSSTLSLIRLAVPIVLAAGVVGGGVTSMHHVLTRDDHEYTGTEVIEANPYTTMDDLDTLTTAKKDEVTHERQASEREAVAELWSERNPDSPIRIEILTEEADQQREQQALELRAEGHELDPFGGNATWFGFGDVPGRDGQPQANSGDDSSGTIRLEILPEAADEQRQQQALELNAAGSGFDVLGTDVNWTGEYAENEGLTSPVDTSGSSEQTSDGEPNGGLYEIWAWQDGELVAIDSVESFLD